MAVYVVWSSQLGAEESHVPDATGLIPDPRVRHYWDGEQVVGGAYQEPLGLTQPAWDVWMLFDGNASWGDTPPAPAWWEHQLTSLPDSLRLDPERFARKAEALLSGAATPDGGP